MSYLLECVSPLQLHMRYTTVIIFFSVMACVICHDSLDSKAVCTLTQKGCNTITRLLTQTGGGDEELAQVEHQVHQECRKNLTRRPLVLNMASGRGVTACVICQDPLGSKPTSTLTRKGCDTINRLCHRLAVVKENWHRLDIKCMKNVERT